jgi:hypothetical protein
MGKCLGGEKKAARCWMKGVLTVRHSLARKAFPSAELPFPIPLYQPRWDTRFARIRFCRTYLLCTFLQTSIVVLWLVHHGDGSSPREGRGEL